MFNNTFVNPLTKRSLCLKLAALSTIVPMLFPASPSFALFGSRTCKDVNIEVANNTGEPIRIVDLEYHSDQTGWKNEVVKDHILKAGGSWTDTRNLESVDDYHAKVRVQYRTLKNGKWSWKISETDSSYQECFDGTTYSISVR